MYKRLHKAYARNAMWLANYNTIGELIGMTVNNYPIWPASAYVGAAGEIPQKLLGLPLYFSQHCPELGNEGDLILLNPKEYVVGLRQSIAVERSNSAEWGNDLISLRAVARAAGQSLWNCAIQPTNGDTLSWAICLQ